MLRSKRFLCGLILLLGLTSWLMVWDAVQAPATTALVITLLSPPSGSTVHPPAVAGGGSVVTLELEVTAPSVGTVGKPVQGAVILFVVDGVVRCTTATSSTGMASCVLTVPMGGVALSYQWYAYASKPGYTPAKSVTWTFNS